MGQSDLKPLIEGVDVDPQTRCRHWHSAVDVVAQQYPCCQRWFACHDCHAELAGHPAQRWPQAAFDAPAVYCGAGGHTLTIASYLKSQALCPQCKAGFNPACASHRSLYFEGY